jgi:2-keto-3-deoxy-L-rhamnonate aldolase RhmA
LIAELEKARRFKEKLKRNEVCLGAQIALSDPTVAEIFGRAGFDWLILDTEHSAQTLLTVRGMLQAVAGNDAVALARPLKFDADEIRRFLDLGSPGVLCPFIETGEEAKALVRACRYPPAGIRSWGPRRAAGYGFDTVAYAAQANASMICITIIESKKAVDNIDEIVSVESVDGVIIGPLDLSISLGCFQKFDDPRYLEAIEKVRKACRKIGKATGTACYSEEHARSCVFAGDSLLLVAGDDLFLASEAARQIKELRAVQAERTPPK